MQAAMGRSVSMEKHDQSMAVKKTTQQAHDALGNTFDDWGYGLESLQDLSPAMCSPVCVCVCVL